MDGDGQVTTAEMDQINGAVGKAFFYWFYDWENKSFLLASTSHIGYSI